MSDTRTVRIRINGSVHEAEVEPRRTLADFIREDAGLKGTHLACEHGFCGNCNVTFDGDTIRYRRVEYDIETTVGKIYAVPELENFLGDRLRDGR